MKNPFNRWLSPDLDPEIAEAIDDLPEGELDALPGTDGAQVRRFFSVARRLHRASCLEVTGTHHIPMGPIVLVANQSGQFPLDALSLALSSLLYASPPRLLRLLRPAGSSDVVSSLLAKAGVNLPLVYEAGGAALLREGHALLTFPEGLVSPSKLTREPGRLLPFALSPFQLAIATRAALVPVAVRPEVRLIGSVSYFPLPTRFRLVFGEPIVALGDETPAGLAAAVQARVQRLATGGLPALGR